MPITDEAYEEFESVIGEEADEGGFVLLPPGVYPFTIEEPVDRERFSGSDKMPACWKANLKLKVDADELGSVAVFYNLFLTKKQAWKIKQLFVGLGLVDPNDSNFTPPWNKIVGTSGVVEIGNREYNGNKYNDVKKILSPLEGSEAIAKKIAETPSFNYPKA